MGNREMTLNICVLFHLALINYVLYSGRPWQHIKADSTHMISYQSITINSNSVEICQLLDKRSRRIIAFCKNLDFDHSHIP